MNKVIPAYAAFVKERFASGDFKNISPLEAMKLISQEWKSLGAAEKKVCIKNTTLIQALTYLQKYTDAYTAQKNAAASA